MTCHTQIRKHFYTSSLCPNDDKNLINKTEKNGGFGRKDFDITVSVNSKRIFLPEKLYHIAISIENAKGILDLEECWDGYGAEPITIEVFNRAADFIIDYSKYILKNYDLTLKSPQITTCVNGTIDLLWKTKKARLLVNIKKINNPIFASCYGDLYDSKQALKSPIQDSEVVEHIAFWMKNIS